MKVKFKKLHPEAVLPKYAKPGDAGMDLTATSRKYEGSGIHHYGTGIAVEIPEGYVGLIFPRSSIYKGTLSLTNSVGVIDSGYRGEICFKFRCHDYWERTNYEAGERVGQLVIIPYPRIEAEWADELSDSDRGTGGFGSTGA